MIEMMQWSKIEILFLFHWHQGPLIVLRIHAIIVFIICFILNLAADLSICIIIIIIIIIFNNNNNNNNLYFTRVTQSNTGFDFRCGPPISGLYLSCFGPQSWKLYVALNFIEIQTMLFTTFIVRSQILILYWDPINAFYNVHFRSPILPMVPW